MADVSDGQVPVLPDDLINAAKAEIQKAMSGALNQSTNLVHAPPEQSPSEEGLTYVEPIQDPYGKAIKYLEQHNILQLFQVSLLSYHVYSIYESLF